MNLYRTMNLSINNGIDQIYVAAKEPQNNKALMRSSWQINYLEQYILIRGTPKFLLYKYILHQHKTSIYVY